MSKYFYCYHLILYKKLFKEHLLNTFNQCLIDKIYQLETRHTLNLVTDENLNIILIKDGFSIYYEALNEIKKKKDFSFGIIISIIKNWKKEKIKNIIKSSFEWKKNYPDLIYGIYLNSDEENFPSFNNLKDLLLPAEKMRKEHSIYLPWILDCGESLRYKTEN